MDSLSTLEHRAIELHFYLAAFDAYYYETESAVCGGGVVIFVF